MGNSIPDQLILVMMTLEYRELWDSYTKLANLDDGVNVVMGQRSSPYQYILVVMLIF